MPEHKYTFISQAAGGTVPDAGSVLLLDNNVIQELRAVARSGFKLERPADQRVAALLCWLAARPDVAISGVFGIIEAAKFAQGGLDRLEVVRLSSVVLTTMTWGREHAEQWIASAEPLPDLPIPAGAHPEGVLAFAEAIVPWTTLACYVATLAVAVEDRRNVTPVDQVRAVHGRLVEELDFVPLFGWVYAALLFLGRPSLRDRLRKGVYKLRQNDVRKNALSAAWDLGFFSLLSVLRTPTLAPLVDERVPVLVTADKHLGPVAPVIDSVGDTGVFTVAVEQLDVTWADEAWELLEALSRQRRPGAGTAPTWSRCLSAVSRLEEELGLDDAPVLGLSAPIERVEVDPARLAEFLQLTRLEKASDVVARLDDFDDALLRHGMLVVSKFVADDADARNRGLDASWEAVIDRLPAEARNVSSLALTVALIRALAAEDFDLARAWEAQLGLDQSWGFVRLWVWQLARAALVERAAHLGEPVDELLERLIRAAQRLAEQATTEAGHD